MSSDSQMYYIPKRLDEPERFLFLSTDEMMVMLVPFIVLYFFLDLFLIGFIASLLSLYCWKRFKGSEQANLHIYSMYWFYPAGVMNLKATPPSYIRTYYG